MQFPCKINCFCARINKLYPSVLQLSNFLAKNYGNLHNMREMYTKSKNRVEKKKLMKTNYNEDNLIFDKFQNPLKNFN